MELYKNLGLTENPFSTFSAEEEKNFLSKIYVNPLFYETLKSDISKGHSRFILGSRGIGKTALLLQLRENLKNTNVFTIIIDEFDDIPVKNNDIEISRLIIEKLVTFFCVEISKCPARLSDLDKHQKEKLSFIRLTLFLVGIGILKS